LAEFPAHGAHFLVEGGGEHHDLLLVGGGAEDALHVLAHAQLGQHVVALVQDEVLHLLAGQEEIEERTGGEDRRGHGWRERIGD
jgi:hypothetical protein